MNERDTDLISVIKIHCRRVINTLERTGNDRTVLLNDQDYYDAVCLNIMQIGEYANRLSDEFIMATSDRINWRSVRRMRNIVAHEYDSVDFDVIWHTAVNQVPEIYRFCLTILKETE